MSGSGRLQLITLLKNSSDDYLLWDGKRKFTQLIGDGKKTAIYRIIYGVDENQGSLRCVIIHSMSAIETPISRGRIVNSLLLGWLVMISFDFLLHGGILARHYTESHPFLLPPMQAFRLIPLGYLSFLLIAVLLVWIMLRLRICGFKKGAIFGLKLGALIWASLTLGLASVSTAEQALLVGWFIGQSIEASLAGGVIGVAFTAKRLRNLVAKVIVFMIGCVLATLALQWT